MLIDVPLQPKQRQLWELIKAEAGATNIGYGGSRGGSKSHGARACALLSCLTWQDIHVMMFRRTFNDLWENHIQPLFMQYPYMREWYHTQNKELTVPFTRSVLKFRFAENPGDVDQFQGKQYAFIFVDEATKLTEDERNKLKMCNRWMPRPGLRPKMVETMNPGGKGHAHIKRLYIDKRYKQGELPEDYAFIQAYGWDNVGWCDDLAREGLSEADFYNWSDEKRFEYFIHRTNYGRILNNMPGKLRIGHLLGRWDVFAGQFFDIWDEGRMVRSLRDLKLEDWHPRWLSIDWGFEHNTAVLWHATYQANKHATYRELLVNHKSPRDLAIEIANRNRGEVLDTIYLGRDAWAKRTDEDTVAEQLTKAFRELGLPMPQQADDDRVGGWMLMYELLDKDEWVITDNCVNLIERLPMLTRDEDDVEDVEKTDGDDSPDAARYGLKSRLKMRQTPLVDRVQVRITSPDPSVRQIQYQIAVKDEQRRTQGQPFKLRQPAWRRRPHV